MQPVLLHTNEGSVRVKKHFYGHIGEKGTVEMCEYFDLEVHVLVL